MTGGDEVREGTETELKFAAWPGFELPDFSSGLRGVTMSGRPGLDLDATYFDTPDLRLARRDVTLRHRSGDGRPCWTLKFPSGRSASGGDADGVLTRREIDVDGDEGVMPAELAELVIGYVRSGVLDPVARLRTRRNRSRMIDQRGRVAAEVDDDEVSVYDGARVVATFREVEFELTVAAPDGLARQIAKVMAKAGAGSPDPTPKLVRALGPRALAAPELSSVRVDEDADFVRLWSGWATGVVRRLVDADHVVRLDDDIEGVHRARVATRRLRSNIKSFSALLDADEADLLLGELGWLARELGQVRDADVMALRLGSLARPISERLARDRKVLIASLRSAMTTDRYVDLLDRLVDRVASGAVVDATAAARERPGAVAVTRIAATRWQRLCERADALDPGSIDERFHDVRISMKKMRYVAEMAAMVMGDEVAGFTDALADAQGALGELNDAVVLRSWLVEMGPTLAPDVVPIVENLIDDQEAEAAKVRARWAEVWSSVNRKRLTRWMR